MKIFIDDIRNSEDSTWVIIRTYQDFVNLLHELLTKQKGWVEELSLDYDLSNTDSKHDGTDCLQELIRVCIKYSFPLPNITIHSSYPRVERFFEPIIHSYNMYMDEENKVKLIGEEEFCEENKIDYLQDIFIELTDKQMSNYRSYFKVIVK